MVAGHLRIKDGNYHIVLSYNDENGKRKSTCRSTHLPVRGNKKRAEAMLQEARREMEETLRCQELAKRQDKSPERKPIFFTDFMNEWLSMMKPSLLPSLSLLSMFYLLRNLVSANLFKRPQERFFLDLNLFLTLGNLFIFFTLRSTFLLLDAFLATTFFFTLLHYITILHIS